MTGRRVEAAGQILRTIGHLRPAQIAHRGRLRAQRAALGRWGDRLAPRLARPTPAVWGWPAAFVPLDAVSAPAPALSLGAADAFTFLGETRDLGHPSDWEQAGASQLWRYHLHYWEWAWSLAAAAAEDPAPARVAFGRLWSSWKAGTRVGRWDAWSPFVVSLRTWVLCGVHASMVAGSGREPGFVDDIALHAGFVAANLERDVGGNHLVKNVKALAGAGVFLGDERLVVRAERALAAQLGVQILGDGGHFERSPSYHCQVLGDLIDVAGLLRSAGRDPIPGLDEAAAAMRRWLGTMLLPDGEVPLLNDCTPVDAARLAALGPVAPADEPLNVLGPSGYVVVRLGRWHLVADVGLPCPPQLPAHAHADTLSFVLCADGRLAVLDTGTSEYGAGPRRQYERSTAAHNTVEVDGVDSTEVFGAFRAGRRARAHLERAHAGDGTIAVTASHDGYRHLAGRPVHRRTWTVTGEEVEITDDVSGRGVHTLVARLHTDAPCLVTGSTARAGCLAIETSGGAAAAAGPDLTTIAVDFGRRRPACCLEVRDTGVLPLRIVVRLRAEDRAPGGPRPE